VSGTGLDLSLTGLPAIVLIVGFVVVFSAPVWLAARLVRARHPTLLRAIGSLIVGTVGLFLIALFTGPLVFLLAPLSFLLSFKYILGTSILGSLALAILAALGYAAIGYFIGSGSFPMPSPAVNV